MYKHLIFYFIYYLFQLIMTTRPYRQFKEKWLGKRIDYDKAY